MTETSEYIGRVTAINRVDLVARVAGFIEERTATVNRIRGLLSEFGVVLP